MENIAFQITEEDVENVLRSNALHAANTNGKSFESIAAEICDDLDHGKIESAALYGNDMEQQTNYACDEIARQLREKGILEPLKTSVTDDGVIRLDEWTSIGTKAPTAVTGQETRKGCLINRGMNDEEAARAYAKEVFAFFKQHGANQSVFVIKGPTSTTKCKFEVVDASCGYVIVQRFGTSNGL
jgi:hypothetical protein